MGKWDQKPRKKRCGAKCRDGSRCKAWAMKGHARCRMHPGNRKAKAEAPNAKRSGASTVTAKSVKSLRQRKEEALSNPELLSLRDQIATSEAMIKQAEEALFDHAETFEFDDVEKAWDKLFAFVQKAGLADAEEVEAMREVIDRGADGFGQIKTLAYWMERKRRLTDSERRHLIRLQQTVTLGEMAAHQARLTEVILDLVENQLSPSDDFYDALEKRLSQYAITDASGMGRTAIRGAEA